MNKLTGYNSFLVGLLEHSFCRTFKCCIQKCLNEYCSAASFRKVISVQTPFDFPLNI